MARMKPSWVIEQGRLIGTFDPEEECILEFTVPISANEEFFRIGWSLKGLRHSGWIAMSTGHAVWSKQELQEPAMHIMYLMEEVVKLATNTWSGERR